MAGCHSREFPVNSLSLDGSHPQNIPSLQGACPERIRRERIEGGIKGSLPKIVERRTEIFKG